MRVHAKDDEQRAQPVRVGVQHLELELGPSVGVRVRDRDRDSRAGSGQAFQVRGMPCRFLGKAMQLRDRPCRFGTAPAAPHARPPPHRLAVPKASSPSAHLVRAWGEG